MCLSQPSAVGRDSSVVLAGEAPGEHISTRAFQAKLRCCVVMALFRERCARKQAGFCCTCLIFCQLICLADDQMTEECWHAMLGLFSYPKAGGFLELVSLGQPTKRVLLELLLRVNIYGAAPPVECPANCMSPPGWSNCFSSTFTSACHPRASPCRGFCDII